MNLLLILQPPSYFLSRFFRSFLRMKTVFWSYICERKEKKKGLEGGGGEGRRDGEKKRKGGKG